MGEVDGSSNSWNATSTTASQSSQRKNPASVSTVARAVWQASHTLHRVHIGKLGHKRGDRATGFPLREIGTFQLFRSGYISSMQSDRNHRRGRHACNWPPTRM